MNILRSSQRGETIVEVMICLAAVGFALAGAFALTGRNQATVQASQERSRATKVMETELELLRGYTSFADLDENDSFCLRAAPGGGTNPITDPDTIVKEPAASPSCVKDDLFTIKIDNPTALSADLEICDYNRSLKITVEWDSLINGQKDQLISYYTACNSAGTSATPGIPLPQCNDGFDNADPEDVLTDLADPDCGGNPLDNNETNTILPLNLSLNGNAYDSCNPADDGPDNYDGCFYSTQCGANGPGCVTGNSMFARRVFTANYDVAGLSQGPATLEIKYKEYGSPGPAPTYGGYQLRISFSGGIADKIHTLPRTDPGSPQQTYTDNTITLPANAGSVTNMSVHWLNNDGGGGDPDIQIDSIRIYR